jgi:predicted nucleic acid-binding protein
MPQMRQLVDTNILVRFFTGDPPGMAAKSRRLVDQADRGKATLVVFPVIVAEAYYTLESFYEINRKTIADNLIRFLQCRGIESVEGDRILAALKLCRDRNAHFADAYLAAAAIDMKTPVASFDRDFDKFADVHRIEPNA